MPRNVIINKDMIKSIEYRYLSPICTLTRYCRWPNHMAGLVQERRNSKALAMELRLSCTNPAKCFPHSTDLWDIKNERNFPEQYLFQLLPKPSVTTYYTLVKYTFMGWMFTPFVIIKVPSGVKISKTIHIHTCIFFLTCEKCPPDSKIMVSIWMLDIFNESISKRIHDLY